MTMDWRPDVIVIGAGVAGLAAAGPLTRAGSAVEILEARQRIGGRVYTLYDPLCPVPIELGAEFVHGRPPEIWRFIDAGQLPAVEMNADSRVVSSGRTQPAGAIFGSVDPLLERMAGAPEQSFEHFIRNTAAEPDERRWAVSYVEGFNAARKERISVRALAQEQAASGRIDGDRSFRLVGGYGALVRELWNAVDRRRARLRLGAVVSAVRWRRGHVEVTVRLFGRERKIYAPRLVVTVPLGVLQAPAGSDGAVVFDPEPEALRAAREAIAMGHAVRVTLRFRQPLWERREEFQNLGFLFSDEDWMPTWWTSLPIRAPVITGWTAGAAAEDHVPANGPLAGAVHTLARLLHTDETSLTSELEACHTHDWRSDPYARGAYTYVQPGGLDARNRFGEPIDDTLYFAGEATEAEGHAATVHGAIATGERAARAILGERSH
jgi:monoamine oxidase